MSMHEISSPLLDIDSFVACLKIQNDVWEKIVSERPIPDLTLIYQQCFLNEKLNEKIKFSDALEYFTKINRSVEAYITGNNSSTRREDLYLFSLKEQYLISFFLVQVSYWLIYLSSHEYKRFIFSFFPENYPYIIPDYNTMNIDSGIEILFNACLNDELKVCVRNVMIFLIFGLVEKYSRDTEFDKDAALKKLEILSQSYSNSEIIRCLFSLQKRSNTFLNEGYHLNHREIKHFIKCCGDILTSRLLSKDGLLAITCAIYSVENIDSRNIMFNYLKEMIMHHPPNIRRIEYYNKIFDQVSTFLCYENSDLLSLSVWFSEKFTSHKNKAVQNLYIKHLYGPLLRLNHSISYKDLLRFLEHYKHIFKQNSCEKLILIVHPLFLIYNYFNHESSNELKSLVYEILTIFLSSLTNDKQKEYGLLSFYLHVETSLLEPTFVEFVKSCAGCEVRIGSRLKLITNEKSLTFIPVESYTPEELLNYFMSLRKFIPESPLIDPDSIIARLTA